ncbi:hypothetical protein HHI36_008667 [Cryptolaemus montrouzieri]|uniref:Disintegrin and metalloproteinase domain-containing protein 12 n=1 Tax=Cryptolaemus montrouzieri TaxID=559131 RepID=A0ABD2MTA4_9CUCU
MYRHSNLAAHNKTCGYKGTDEIDHHKQILRYKRDLDQSDLIRGPYNANRESKYVELVLVIDNREYKELGENRQRVVHHCKTIANIINGLYSPLNIFIALVGVVIWTERDEISFSKNGDETLTNFLHYRREKLIKDHPNDNAQLLSKFNFDNGVVGKALKGPICTYEYWGVNTDHSPIIGLVATTIAHEMGHNFGMEHDTNDCKCPDTRCIMAPSSSTEAPTHWSSCSLNYLLLAFTHGMDYCLKNKPQALFDSPVCGNGFVEPGEQCDCGLPEHCDNTCCNATSCMLYSNASCATGECCDLSTCMPKNAGVLCRSADYECDLPEYCTGQSEFCPGDVYKMDTEVCDNGKAYCYHGFCRTRTDQCKLLWGETGKSSDEQCYKMNTKGSRHGNCGYNKFNKSFTKCHNESILCGMLHCRHLNERLEFGMESVAILSQSFINSRGTIIPCRNAIVDLGINQIDPGLAPDGAACGVGKMCVNQRCMSVENLRAEGVKCPDNCNNNGWCNNLGHCHCKDGFSPPYCEVPGPGGSEDSGPASNPNRNQVYVQLMFIFFLGIVPAIALGAFLYYHLRRNTVYGSHMKSIPSISTNSRQLKTVEDGNGGKGFMEPTKRTEDNHSLLREDSPPPIGFQIGLFGHFKICLTPSKQTNIERPQILRPPPPVPSAAKIQEVASIPKTLEPIRPAPIPPPQVHKEIEPVRSAPPPPTVLEPRSQNICVASNVTASPAPSVTTRTPNDVNVLTSNFFNKPLRVPSFRKYPLSNPFSQGNNVITAPALPPLNPNQSTRPIISSPVLESSTSTAKELMSPPRKAPIISVKPQVMVPEQKEKGTDSVDFVPPKPTTNTNLNTTNTLKKPLKDNTSSLNRITSFLKPSDKKPTLQHRPSQIKANKIDREQLRSMEISNPIPQSQIDLAENALPVSKETTQAVVMRSKSMRSDVSKKPVIPTFGSMRNPSGLKRPVSIPCGARPKIPPPPRPPPILQNEYDDCLNKKCNSREELGSPMSTDNIYAVIEESPKHSESTANDSFGLLGEIVSEIKNRNFDSIYSTSTLAKKRKEQEEKDDASVGTENTYSNMGNMKSSASSTSSGYIQPNIPLLNAYVQPSTLPKPVEVHNAEKKETKSESINQKIMSKSNSKEKLANEITNKQKEPPKLNKQTTPVNLRSRRSSPSSTTNKNRLTNNSPDLVTSCNSKSSKPPDVLNRGSTHQKKPTVSVKPNVNTTPKVTSKVAVKPTASKVLQSKKSNDDLKNDAKKTDGAVKDSKVGVKNLPNRSNSRVAALQQKFQQ